MNEPHHWKAEGKTKDGTSIVFGIEFDLDYWFGYTKRISTGKIYDSAIYFRMIDNRIYGFLKDYEGAEIWDGTIEND